MVDRAKLLSALPGDVDLVVAFIGFDRAPQPGLLPVGQVLSAGAQNGADAVERVAMVTFEGGQYSVPHRIGDQNLLGCTVWVRTHGAGNDEQIVITYVGGDGPVEVARHRRATPGTPQLIDQHFDDQPAGAVGRRPRPRNAAETEFLALGEGAALWLVEAAAAGTTKMRVKMAEALALAKLFDPGEVDWALGHAAVHGRFAEADLASILDHHARQPQIGEQRAGEDSSLTQGTTGWARLGRPARSNVSDDEGEVVA